MVEFPKKYTPIDQKSQSAPFPLFPEVQGKKNTLAYSAFMPPYRIDLGISSDHIFSLLTEDVLVRFHEMLGKETFFPEISYTYIPGSKKHTVNPLSELSLHTSNESGYSSHDTNLSLLAEKTFIDLYQKNLITYEESIVSYSPALQSVVSDAGIDHREVEGRLYSITYFVAGADYELTIMTTEPETIFADMALAVHPRDKRYKKLVGKKALIPIVNKAIPIITDARVNMNFAHGVKRITPAHHREDFAIAKEHGLETDFSIIDQNGKMKKEASMFVGQDAKTEARGNIVELLRSKGNLIKTEVSHHMEDYCNETGCRVEPIMSREWFVNTNVLKGRVIAGYEKGEFLISPEKYKGFFEEKLLSESAWCISRYQETGMKIPAYFHKETGELLSVTDNPQSLYDTYRKDLIVRETRSLDPYFALSLFPMLVSEWSTQYESLRFRTFYPFSHTTCNESLFSLWAFRAMMMSYEYTNLPFARRISLHQKSSDRIDIPLLAREHSSDIIRFAILSGNTAQAPEEMIQESSHFITKLWNIVRFVAGETELQAPSLIQILLEKNRRSLLSHERYILSRLSWLVDHVTSCLQNADTQTALRSLIEFTLEDFSGFALEAYKQSKGKYGKDVLSYTTLTLLRLFSPFIPDFTATVWHIIREDAMRKDQTASSFFSLWSEPLDTRDEFLEKSMRFLRSVIGSIRRIRSTHHIKPTEVCKVVIVPDTPHRILFDENESLLRGICRIDLQIGGSFSKEDFAEYEMVMNTEIYVDIASKNISIQGELDRLESQIEEKKGYIRILSEKLGSNTFIQNAPERIVRAEMEKRHIAIEQLRNFEKKKEEMKQQEGR